jgi:aryl sulfotransferase
MTGIKTDMVYLASFPKSGNTWLRIFLGYLIQGEKLDINRIIDFSENTTSRPLFENIIFENSFELTDAEISYYRPKIIEFFIKQQADKPVYLKTHETYIKNNKGNWIFPQKTSYKAIYLVRNPFDVCVSYAHHIGCNDFDKVIGKMSSRVKFIDGSYYHLLHRIGSWSEHIESWLDNFPRERLLVIKYEDMVQKSLDTFSRIIEFIGIDYSKSQIEKAIELSSFEKLQALEKNRPFSEKPPTSKSFFRKGKVGSWKDILTNDQVNQIINEHADFMRQFNYLD